MKNITKESIEKDLNTITEMFCKYHGAIWEDQDNQPDHFDKQPKSVRLCVTDATVGLHVAMNALLMLSKKELIEETLNN